MHCPGISYCYSNQLTTLNVSKNTALVELACDDNQLTTLDVSKNTALVYLYCGNNTNLGNVIISESCLGKVTLSFYKYNSGRTYKWKDGSGNVLSSSSSYKPSSFPVYGELYDNRGICIQRTTFVTSVTPDLSTSNGGTLSATSVPQDESFTLSGVSVSNIGTAASGTYTITYYASTDTTIDASDALLETYTMSSLDAGSSTTDSRTFSVSNLTAETSYYIGWIITGTGDSDTSNNTGRTTSMLTVTAPVPPEPSLTVNSVLDVINASDGVTTLREAMALAEAGDVITFDDSLDGQTITLYSQLAINNRLQSTQAI